MSFGFDISCVLSCLRCTLEAILIPSTIRLKMFPLLFCVFFLSFPHQHTCRGGGGRGQGRRLPHTFFLLLFVLFVLCLIRSLFCFLISALLTCFVSFFPFCFLSAIQYLQMKWPLLDVQPGGLQSRQALKDARSPSPAHIVVSKIQSSVLLLF